MESDPRVAEQRTRPKFVLDLPEVSSPEELFRAVASRLVDEGLITDPEPVVSELLNREAQGSTGVGNEIALPHAIVDLPLKEVVFAFVRVRRGTDWHSVDGEPVKLIALLIAPSTRRREYLHVLADVARVLEKPFTRSALIRARSETRILRLLTGPTGPGFVRRNRNIFILAAAVLATYILARILLPMVNLPDQGIYHELDYARFNTGPWIGRQSITTAIFLGMVLGTLLFWRFRVAIAAASLGILLLSGVMDVQHAVEYMSLPTVIFIMAMMALVKWLESVGVFRFVVVAVVQRIGSSPIVLLMVLMFFSLVLSGFAGEVSGILVTFGLALEIARRTKTSVLPYLLSLVFATNVGSALTLVGNPIGVYIAFAGRLTFEDFLRWATPLAFISCIAVAATSLLIFRKRLRADQKVKLNPSELRDDSVRPRELRLGMVVFCAVVLAIVLHARAEALLHLGEGTLLMVVPLIAIAFVVFFEQERGKALIERGIDWWTLLFFMFLFANAACLEHTGVTTKLGYLLLEGARLIPLTQWLGPSGLTGSTLVLMLWGSGISSGFVDNMPIVAALVPIVKNLSAVGLPHASILWWSLLLGGCFGGNLTMIGSSANLVALGVYEKATGKQVKFGEWFAAGALVTVISLAMATIGLLLQVRFAE